MKNCVMLGLILCLTGCAQINDTYFSARFADIPLYYADYSGIQDVWGIPYYYDAVKYAITDDLQTPQETLTKGTADCEGYALLYMNIAYIRFGLKCDLVLTLSGRAIVEGGAVDHAVIRLPSGIMVNAQTGSIYHGPICYIYSFDEVFQ